MFFFFCCSYKYIIHKQWVKCFVVCNDVANNGEGISCICQPNDKSDDRVHVEINPLKTKRICFV
jgi:hypothetical protein